MKREPLTLRALGSLVVSAILDVILVFGVSVPDGLEKALVELTVAAAVVYTALAGRRKVTPVNDPRDTEGGMLISAPSRGRDVSV